MDYKPGSEVEIDGDYELGQIRDAFHCPVVLTEAEERLQPGQRVKLSLNCATAISYDSPDGYSMGSDDWTAVVDPFLPSPVEKGERFWAFVRGDLTKGVRHHFEIETSNYHKGRSEFCGARCG